MFGQFGFKQICCSLGGPCKINIYEWSQISQKNYFASDDELVAAISIRKCDTRFILEKPHVETIVAAVLVVGLVESPAEVRRKRDEVHSGAPRPLSFTTLLRPTCPVVQVEGPVACEGSIRHRGSIS